MDDEEQRQEKQESYEARQLYNASRSNIQRAETSALWLRHATGLTGSSLPFAVGGRCRVAMRLHARSFVHGRAHYLLVSLLCVSLMDQWREDKSIVANLFQATCITVPMSCSGSWARQRHEFKQPSRLQVGVRYAATLV